MSRDEKTLVYQVESEILQRSCVSKLSYRSDPHYFTGRAGAVRILSLVVASASVYLMTQGYDPITLSSSVDQQTVMMMKSNKFSGYKITYFTLSAIAFGGCTLTISCLFIVLLYLFLENQRVHVLACILSVAAAFCDIMSIQKIQEYNCDTLRCREEIHNTRNLKFEEPFYPPYFLAHYIAFVGFLINAMLYSIASRIWLRNDD